MVGFRCPIQSFPCTYLGLPLHLKRLRRVEFQPLIDKMSNRLPAWQGRFLNRARRLKLLNSVLSSMPVYFLSVFAPPKWLLKKVDRIRRGFLWKGTESANGGHCLVRWTNVQKPEDFGRLGVLDLERFSRALRLRWLWVGGEVPCNDLDKLLFRPSTRVSVGNGHKASFWHSSWVHGQAPRDLTPNLFKLAWRKNNSVVADLANQNWLRGLWKMSSVQEIAEFISLWGLVHEVQLSQDEDSISWKWTTHGIYTSKSAYVIQFTGAFCSFNAQAIWRAQSEGKHRVFAWLLVQNKILTADWLLTRNWSCNPMCVLCDQLPETVVHLCLTCVFAREGWVRFAARSGGRIRVLEFGVSMEMWWNSSLAGLSRKDRRWMAVVLIYIPWGIWKERNRRIFEGWRHCLPWCSTSSWRK